MPAALHRMLKRRAAEKFPGDKKRQERYVYGTLNKIERGDKPRKQKARV